MRLARRLLVLGALLLLGAWLAEVLPRAHLAAPPPTPILLDRHGAFLAQLGHEQDGTGGARLVEYGFWAVPEVPDRVARAILALEDRRFAWHPGVDPVAVGRAVWQRLSGAPRRSGASTIAMQVARMQQPAPRGLWAKSVEAGVAVAITLRHGREAVLAHYLRLVPYGNSSHGIGHAARWYFDKPVADLSWAEIALLSALPQAPARLDPMTPSGFAGAVRRGARALEELARQGTIGPEELALARSQLAALAMPAPPRRPDSLHAVLRLREMLAEQGAPGLDPADPRLRARLDLALQGEVAAIARRHLAERRAEGAQQVAALVVRRTTREVLAAVGSGGYGAGPGGAIDFTRAVRSPGSTLKPFVYALALERGLLDPAQVMADLPEGASGVGNSDGAYLGPLLPRQALANSRNVPATNLLRRIGLDGGFAFLRDLGLHDQEGPAEAFGLTMAIGTLPTTLERLMRAYAALASEGVLGELVWHERQAVVPPRRVLSAAAARQVTLFLADPLARLPGFPRYGPTDFPFAAALKTGTSQGYRDAWMVAWSQEWIVGVWLGRADAGPMRGLSGARAAAPLAQAILLHLHATRPDALVDGGFPPPEGHVAVPLCAFTGARQAGHCARSLTEWLPPDHPAAAPPPAPVAAPRAPLAVPAAHRAWAAAQGFPLPAPAAPDAAVRLSILAPEHNSRIWRNPEVPPRLNRLLLRAAVEPRVAQVVWTVNGEPFALADPDQPVAWPLTPGAHRFQVRLPSGEAASAPVRIVVE